MEKKRKILIVDDERELCESIKNVFGDKEFSCSFAYDGGSSLSMVEKEKPDLILLDIMIPGLDGFEVTQRIKHNEKFKDIPIIILTVLGDSKDRIAGFKAGADDYLTKPFDPDELVLRIKANLRMREFSSQLKKKIEELKENERIKAEFLTNITSEFSLPLQDIINETNLFLSEEYGKINKRQKEAIKRIGGICPKITSLLSTVNDIARANSGKVWINIEEFSIQEIINLVNARCKNEAEVKGLLWSVSYPEITIKTDKVHLIKILDELLLNAIKFTQFGEVSLLIKEDKENDTVIFEVIDTGRGIEKECLDKLFDEGARDGRINLILVKKLTSILRGDIRVESKDIGSRFTVVLPRLIDSPARRKEDKI